MNNMLTKIIPSVENMPCSAVFDEPFPIYTIAQASLPRRLLHIQNPPQELYIRGTLPNEDYTYICVVGSRKYSRYGQDACEALVGSLAGKKVVIVSGLALGIDGIAHQAALVNNIPTIAILGCGLDWHSLYPAHHQSLARSILDSEGALLSEYVPDTRAVSYMFPQRNRIMAGLSDLVIVVEGERHSGTLITARLAGEFGRSVGAVPGSIFQSGSDGPHSLIRDGAFPITSYDDIEFALGRTIPDVSSVKNPDDTHNILFANLLASM